MKLIALAVTLVLLGFGPSPVFAGSCGDSDGDTIDDCSDNCSDISNPDQDDTDGDSCGNLCDADYGQTGIVNFSDWTELAGAYGAPAPNIKLSEPNMGSVGIGDFSAFGSFVATVPGPSGTTTGTTACP